MMSDKRVLMWHIMKMKQEQIRKYIGSVNGFIRNRCW